MMLWKFKQGRKGHSILHQFYLELFDKMLHKFLNILIDVILSVIMLHVCVLALHPSSVLVQTP